MKFIINLLQFLALCVWTALCISLSLIGMLLTLNRSLPLVIARKYWSPVMLLITRTKLKVSGLENVDFSKSYIFASNHQSHLDVICLVNALPVNIYFIAKKELKNVPFLGLYMVATGMIFIDRQNRSKAISSMRKAGEKVKKGKSVITFPEGTRSKNGQMGVFKKGTFVMALQSGIPIVPVAIEGSGKIWPAGHFRLFPGEVNIRLGKPYFTENTDSSQIDELKERVRDTIVEMRG